MFLFAPSPGPEIGDTIGVVRPSELEISGWSEGSSGCSGPKIPSMPFRISLSLESGSPVSWDGMCSKSSGNRDKSVFHHEDGNGNTPVSPKIRFRYAEDSAELAAVIFG